MRTETISTDNRNNYGEWLVALAVAFAATSAVLISVLNIFMPILGSLTGIIRNITLLLLLVFQIKHYGMKIRNKNGFLFFIAYSIYIFLYLNVFNVYKMEENFHAPHSNFSFFYRTAQIIIYLLCAESIIRHLNGFKFLLISFFVSIIPSIFFIQYVGVEVLQLFGQEKDSEDFVSTLTLGYSNGVLSVIAFFLLYKYFPKGKLLCCLFAVIIILSASYVLIIGGERGPIVWSILNLIICLGLTTKTVGKYAFFVFMCGFLFFQNLDTIVDSMKKVTPYTARKIEATLKEGDTNGRFDMNNQEGSTYLISWNQFLTSPIYGSYFRMITNHRVFRASYSHNIFLEIMITMGLLGLLPFIYLLLKVLKNVRVVFKRRRYTESQLLCLILFLSVFLQLQTSNTIVTNTMFWVFFYIMCNYNMPIDEKGIKTKMIRQLNVGFKKV